MLMKLSFFKGKRVFVTGHTGFKGSWLCRVLLACGASVHGYALAPPKASLYATSDIDPHIHSTIGDIRDMECLRSTFINARPDIVIHMAAQPLVRESYEKPLYTFETNIMGTANLLECVRQCAGVQTVLNVTTDKVYENMEFEWGYREIDPLGGHDPYATSKACSELVTASYKKSFFSDGAPPLSTARAGNVIGGGDFSRDRIIPDCVRAVQAGQAIVLRNPGSVRPYQHVLEPLSAYLAILQAQCENQALASSYNIGPPEDGCARTDALAALFCAAWGNGARWESTPQTTGVHEAGFLRLDISKIRSHIGWAPKWSLETAVQRTVEWYKEVTAGRASSSIMDEQISAYYAGEAARGQAHV